MNRNELDKIIKFSLNNINHERFFASERGFQGKLVSELNNRIEELHVLCNKGVIIEQEYQKTLYKHGIKIRPDIIIHIPYNFKIDDDRREGNYIVIELKLRGRRIDVREDFDNINLMFERLNYSYGVFINISSNNNYETLYSGQYRERMLFYSVYRSDDKIYINNSSI